MPGRHSLASETALNALNSPVGRSTAVALAAGTVLGLAMPAVNAEEASVASLAPVNETAVQPQVQGTASVTAASDAAWEFERVEADSGILVSEETRKAIAEENTAAARREQAEVAAREARTNAAARNANTAASATATSQTSSSAQAEVESTTPANNDSAAGASVLATGLSYTGSRYMWGGTTPAGWDCIGFVRYVYAKHGVSIGGSTTSVLSAGRRVSYSEAQPGDILYWPGHVAIYAGNGQNVGAWNASLGTRVGPNSWAGGTPIVIRVFG